MPNAISLWLTFRMALAYRCEINLTRIKFVRMICIFEINPEKQLKENKCWLSDSSQVRPLVLFRWIIVANRNPNRFHMHDNLFILFSITFLSGSLSSSFCSLSKRDDKFRQFYKLLISSQIVISKTEKIIHCQIAFEK